MENIIFLVLAAIFVGLNMGRYDKNESIPETFKPSWFDRILEEIRR